MRRLVLAIALLAACGDDDSGGGSIPIEDLQAAVINAYCNLYVMCGLIDDVATCRAIYNEGELDADLLAAVQAGKVIYHPDKARECLNGIGASCNANTFSNNDAQEACDATFEGTVGAGGQCALSEECRSQDCDIPSCPDACCQGMCVGDAPVRVAVGGVCESSSQCIDSYCDFSAATSTCTAYKQAGQACTSSNQCAVGGCVNMICSALPGPGEACSSNLGGANCANLGYTCSVTSMTCVPYGLTGDACATSRDCSPIYVCGTGGTCVLRPRLGETCDPQASGCIDRSYCEPTTSKCTAPKPDNSPCMDSDECASGNCDFDTSVCVTDPICI
jgi:hypothetical protein